MITSVGKIDALRTRIEDAFADVQYPGDSELVCDDSGEEWLADPELFRLKEAVRGKHWKEIATVVTNPTFADSINFFTQKAFQYYLAAYLIASLDGDYGEGIGEFINSVIRVVTPSSSHRFGWFVEPLTRQQKGVVGEVLRYLERETPDCDKTRKRYLSAAFLEYWDSI